MASRAAAWAVLLYFGNVAHAESVVWKQVQWSRMGPLGRIPAASASCDGQLFIFGGETDSGKGSASPNRYMSDLWKFTPATGDTAAGEWAQLAADGLSQGPAARVSCSMVCSAGSLIVYGGLVRRSTTDMRPVDELWSFNLTTRRWTKLQGHSNGDEPGPGPLTAHTAVIVDSNQDSMVVFGGSTEEGRPTDRTWVYSLSNKTWTGVHSHLSPQARNFHTSVAVPSSSKFKMWGGTTDSTLWVFDVEELTWSPSGTAPDYESGRTGAVVDGRPVSFGGFIATPGKQVYSNILEVQQEGGGWKDAVAWGQNKPAGRCYAALASLTQGVYVYGGYHRDSNSSDAERLSDLWIGALQTQQGTQPPIQV